jgi:hypothetical protein
MMLVWPKAKPASFLALAFHNSKVLYNLQADALGMP